jgi:dTDP-4-dehydrorhamnose 3,5-epimerase
MIFRPCEIHGVFRLEIERKSDERGFFARSFCQDEMAAYGLWAEFPQCNISYNLEKGTFRGLHFQLEPHGEIKIVRCTRGSILDIVLDLRPESPSYLQHVSVELTEESRDALYIPKGCAHGFQTLQANSEVLYMMGQSYHAASASGVRWDDPAFGIRLPLPISSISAKDLAYPLYGKTK